MGGFCSGRWHGHRKKQVVDYCLRIDIRQIQKKRPSAIEKQNLDWSDEQSFRLAQTPCNFGGVRNWFLCPGCDRQVRLLFCPLGANHFKCRQCHSLSYLSCQESGNEMRQSLRRIRRIQKKLHAPKGTGWNAFVWHHKYMRWDKYQRLVQQLRAEQQHRIEVFFESLEKLAGMPVER